MAFKYSSWGRTRSPKNLAGDPGTAITLEANTNDLRAGAAGYKTTGYATENQRYLHVLVEDRHAGGSDPTAITVFGYCHAFERWFEVPQSFDPVGANTGPTAASIDAADSGRTNANQVPSDREYRVYQIVGIDRVAFVGDDDLANVFAACSTF
jgi:hypothetical protein